MRKIWFFLISTMSLVVIMSSCLFSASKARLFTNDLEELNGVDQVRLNVLLGLNKNGVPDEVRLLRTIGDPEQINQAVTKIRTFSENWQYEEFSPPETGISGRIAPIQITFYQEGKVKTLLSIGRSEDMTYFLQESPGPGRYLEYHEFKELMDFLEIDEKLAY